MRAQEFILETRNSLFAYLKQQFPTWPDYVIRDLLYQQARTYVRNKEEFAGWLDMIKRDYGKVKWQLKKLPITLDIFTPKTRIMIQSREGGSANPYQVPRDAERHAQQLKMIQQKGVSEEPIIVAKLSNGYDLIEGWHRTIQHLKEFPQGYTAPAWVGYGATYTSESIKQGVAEGKLVESAIFLNPNTVIVGQQHGQPLKLSPNTLKQIQAIAAKHGAWYEGNGTDRGYTKGQIDRYVGSWDDEVAKTANSNDPKWIYVLFANVDENNRVQRVGIDPNNTIFNRLLDTAKDNSYQGIGYTSQALQKFLQMASEGKYDFVKMSQQPATQENLTRFLKAGEALMWPSNWKQYPNKAGKIAKAATVDVRDQYLATRKAGVYVAGFGHLKAVQNITGKQGVAEDSSNNIPTIGINVRSDGDIDYASLIVDGKKKYESRKTNSLRPYIGKTVGIVRTGNGPAVAIGQVTIGEPIIVDVEKFNKLRNQHLVPRGSKFDIDSDGTKYLYPMINPVRWDNEKPIKNKGIISRKIQEQLDEYNVRKTKKFIQRAHDQEQGQMYGNMPYSSHPKQVANLGKKFFGTKFGPEAVKVALLHDVLEDTPYTPDQLAKKGFSKEVIQAVQLLTKNKALSYADNIRNIINSGNSLAMMVKYSDNYMNYTGDKSHWTPERAAHSQKKYLASLNMLGDVLGIKKHIGDEVLDEYKVDNKNGLGSVPYNQDVDYFGMKVMMKPSTFLQLALPLNKPISVDHIAQHLKNGGSLGAPFLDVTIPKEWEEGDMSEPARVSGHEGRNRMLAIQQVEGDDPVEVHIFPKGGMRARDLTPEITTALRNGMMNQERSRFIRGDLFSTR
jgi:hypothetical protein